MLLVSPQYIGICRLYPENRTLEKLIIQKYFYDEEGAFIFDVSSGFGFPPVSDLNKGRLGFESNSNYRGSISNNIVIRNVDGTISGAYVEIRDGKIYVTLPDGYTLDKDNKTVISLTDKDGKPVMTEYFNFGKYKGKPVAEVLRLDSGYFSWMMGGDFTYNTKQVLTRIRLREAQRLKNG